jgi:DNA polymerase-3 subunit delta
MMTQTEFLKEVAENHMQSVYLMVGEEKLFHEELLSAVLEHILPGDAVEFNLSKLNAAETEVGALFDQLETPPFFGQARVVYLFGLETAKNGIDEALLNVANHLADGVFLLISAIKLDGRKKVHQELQKQFKVVNCNKLNLTELPVWVGKRAQNSGLRLTPFQTGLISQRIGPDLVRIRTELEKIQTFAGIEGKVSDAALNDLLPLEPEPNIFGLIDAVAAGNPRQGIPRLQELLDAGEPELKILSTLAKQFRNIAAALSAKNQGLNHRLLASQLGINPYVAEKSFAQAARFSLSDVHRAISRLLWADFRIKTGQRDPRLELELAVVEICSK